jgi:hypothetical protein
MHELLSRIAARRQCGSVDDTLVDPLTLLISIRPRRSGRRRIFADLQRLRKFPFRL